MTAATLRQRLDAALARRAALLADPQTTVARLVHGAADGLTGLVLERLGPVLIAQLHPGRDALPEPDAGNVLREETPSREPTPLEARLASIVASLLDVMREAMDEVVRRAVTYHRAKHWMPPPQSSSFPKETGAEEKA